MKKRIGILLAVLALFCANCSAPQKEEAVSEGAQKVIEAMTTCPNRDLFDLEASTPIGLGVQQTEAEKAKAAAAIEKEEANWKAAVGAYFTEEGFASFRRSALSSHYLAQAEMGDKKIVLVSTEQKENTASYESVYVTLTVDGEEQKVEMVFSHTPKGLITQVVFDPNALITGDEPA